MPIPTPDLTKLGDDTCQVRIPAVLPKRRVMFLKLPIEICSKGPICCDTNDPLTIAHGFGQRLMRKVPKFDPCLMREFKEYVERFVSMIPLARDMSFNEWIESINQPQARKNELIECHEKLRGGRPSRKDCQKIKTFGKTESYPVYKMIRLINSRSDMFKAFSGRFFKAIEEVVYALPEFIKHTPVPERAAKILSLKQSGMRYFQTDFTAFESHFVAEVMDACELVLYRHCLSWSEHADFICDVIRGTNKMSTRLGVSASVKARRMSGDMCTSLGNGFTNLMLAKFIAHKQGVEINGFVEGDDGIFATTGFLNEDLYKKLGFTIKCQEVSDPCIASFCGNIFCESGEIIKEPSHFLVNFGWTSSFIGAGEKLRKSLLRAKALSAIYELPQCPIIGAASRLALELTRGVCPRFVSDGYHEFPRDEIKIPEFRPDPRTRALFEQLFGYSIDQQLFIEQEILKGNNVDHLISFGDHEEHYSLRYIEYL